MQEAEEPVVALDQAEHLVRRRAVTDGVADTANERIRHLATDPFGRVAGLAGDEEEALQIAVVLLGEAVEHLVEPLPGVAHHHHGHHRWDELVGCFHEGARLLPGSPGIGALPAVPTQSLAKVSTMRYDIRIPPERPPRHSQRIISHVQTARIPPVGCSKIDVDALRNVDFRKFVPNIDAAAIDTDKVTAAVRDAGYIIVGFGVLAVQQAKSSAAISSRRSPIASASSKTRWRACSAAVEPGALLEQARELAESARDQFRDLTRIAA